jgi:copper homeostasis protein
MNSQPILEICTQTLAGVLAADQGGADRIEFCSRLDLDGLTPDISALEEACAATSLPVVAMLRPNPNFLLDSQVVRQMIAEMNPLRKSGAQGFVLGGLNSHGEIPYSVIKEFIAAADGLPVTFHRAFDQVPQKNIALERLKEIGVARLLTSGGRSRALENRAVLKALIDRADNLQVIVGGGVRENQFPTLLATGAAAFHSSLDYQPTAETVAGLKAALTAENDSPA